MINKSRLAVLAVVGLLSSAVVVAALGWILTSDAPKADRAMAACLAAALIMPVAAVYVRHSIRLQRLRVLVQCANVFGLDTSQGVGSAGRQGSASFEYVFEKYTEDLPHPLQPEPQDASGTRLAGQVSGLRMKGERASLDVDRPWWALGSTWALLMASAPLILLCTMGFYAAFAAGAPDVVGSSLRAHWRPLMLVGSFTTCGQKACEARDMLGQGLTIAVFAFAGAYVFALGAVSRAVATFDMSPFMMLRLAMNMVIGVAGAVIAYQAFPSLTPILPDVGDKIVNDLRPGWLALAFVSGLVPDLLVNWLIGQSQKRFGGKVMDSSILKTAPAVSPEIIDGIDFFVRFRLQQANIYEVQNLATANPIMLFVETPYGLYQCIDWVAQAQLCTIVGPERFLILRRYNLRTIFDVERAVLSLHTTSQMRRFVVSLLMSTPAVGGARKWSFWNWSSSTASEERAAEEAKIKDNEVKIVGSPAFDREIMAQFCEEARGPWGAPIANDPDRTLKHLARLMLDDLHVHRLRDIWLLVQRRLDEKGAALPDTECLWTPPKPEGLPRCDCEEPASSSELEKPYPPIRKISANPSR